MKTNKIILIATSVVSILSLAGCSSIFPNRLYDYSHSKIKISPKLKVSEAKTNINPEFNFPQKGESFPVSNYKDSLAATIPPNYYQKNSSIISAKNIIKVKNTVVIRGDEHILLVDAKLAESFNLINSFLQKENSTYKYINSSIENHYIKIQNTSTKIEYFVHIQDNLDGRSIATINSIDGEVAKSKEANSIIDYIHKYIAS